MEADRCLQCPKPYCIEGCPVAVNIPNFIASWARGKCQGPRPDSLLGDNALPCVTGTRLPAGDPVRAGLPARQDRHLGRDRLPRALRRRLGHHAHRVFARANPAPSGKKVAIVVRARLASPPRESSPSAVTRSRSSEAFHAAASAGMSSVFFFFFLFLLFLS